MREKLSAFVISYNRADLLDACLRAASFADELIVVDKSSGDDSVRSRPATPIASWWCHGRRLSRRPAPSRCRCAATIGSCFWMMTKFCPPPRGRICAVLCPQRPPPCSRFRCVTMSSAFMTNAPIIGPNSTNACFVAVRWISFRPCMAAASSNQTGSWRSRPRPACASTICRIPMSPVGSSAPTATLAPGPCS